MVAETRYICRRCQKPTATEPLQRLDLVITLCAPCKAAFLHIEWSWVEENYRRSVGVFNDKSWRKSPPSAGETGFH
jgi:hypothetical protein